MAGSNKQVYSYTVQNDGLFYVMGNCPLHPDSANGAAYLAIIVKRDGVQVDSVGQRLNQLKSSSTSTNTNCQPAAVFRLRKGDVLTWNINGSSNFGNTAYYWTGGSIIIAQLA